MAKYHFFHSHCLCVCIVSLGKRLVLREVRGTLFRSRFDKLVIFSPLVVSQKQPLQYWWCLNVGTSTLCRDRAIMDFSISFFWFILHTTAWPVLLHHTVLYQVELQKSSFPGRFFSSFVLPLYLCILKCVNKLSTCKLYLFFLLPLFKILMFPLSRRSQPVRLLFVFET